MRPLRLKYEKQYNSKHRIELLCKKSPSERDFGKKDKWFVVSYISNVSKYDDRMLISFSNGIDTSA